MKVDKGKFLKKFKFGEVSKSTIKNKKNIRRVLKVIQSLIKGIRY